jgi:hypothetical protein
MERFTVNLVADTYEESELVEFSEDLAWEAALSASHTEGIEIGSDDFVEAFTHLKKRYADCAHAYGHLRHISARTLRALMDQGMALVYPANRCTCKECMTDHLDDMVGILLSQATAVYSVGPIGWINNDEWVELPEEDRTVTFELVKPTKEEDNDRNDR